MRQATYGLRRSESAEQIVGQRLRANLNERDSELIRDRGRTTESMIETLNIEHTDKRHGQKQRYKSGAHRQASIGRNQRN